VEEFRAVIFLQSKSLLTNLHHNSHLAPPIQNCIEAQGVMSMLYRACCVYHSRLCHLILGKIIETVATRCRIISIKTIKSIIIISIFIVYLSVVHWTCSRLFGHPKCSYCHVFLCSPDLPESEASYAITAGGIADAKEWTVQPHSFCWL